MLLSAILIRKHNSPGTFAHFRVPRHAGSGLAGMGCSTDSPALFGHMLLIPEVWEPVPALPCGIPVHPVPGPCCQQLLLLDLPVNVKYLSCSACTPDEDDGGQTAFWGCNALPIKALQRKEVLKPLSMQHARLVCQETSHLPSTYPWKLKPYANSSALRPRPATTHSLYPPTLPPQPLI